MSSPTVEVRHQVDAIKIARKAVHDLVRAYSIKHGSAPSPEWAGMSVETQEGTTTALLHHADMIRAGNPVSPKESHEMWPESRKKEGWIYGKVKDFEKKIHPSLIPYDELPEVERRKDDLFIACAELLVKFEII